MAAGHLTQRQIDALRPRPGRQYVVWDGALPGFGVRVNPKGTKTFILKYRLRSGRVRWKTLGRVGALALARAMRLAKVDVGVVADGGDPQAPKDAARDGLTVSDVASRFLDEHVDARRKPATQRLYRLAIERHLAPRLGALPIADVSADALLKLHNRLRATPYLANRVIAVASKLMNWAALKGYRGEGPHVNPCLGIEKFKEESRQRYLTKDELKRLGAALRVGERRRRVPPSAAAAIRLLLVTGARCSETRHDRAYRHERTDGNPMGFRSNILILCWRTTASGSRVRRDESQQPRTDRWPRPRARRVRTCEREAREPTVGVRGRVPRAVRCARVYTDDKVKLARIPGSRRVASIGTGENAGGSIATKRRPSNLAE